MVLFSIALEGDRGLNEYKEIIPIVEEGGFYSVHVYEHLPYRPAWLLATQIAAVTKRVKVGPVTVPVYLYHPVNIARFSAYLNEISNGRAIVGISRGAYYENISPIHQRSIDAVDECVKIVLKLLRDGRAYYGGRVYRVRHSLESFSIPADIEVYIGTSGPKLASMASKIGGIKGIVVDNLWNPSYAGFLRDIVKRSRDSKNFQLIARPFCAIAEDSNEAIYVATKALKKYLLRLAPRSPMLSHAGISPKNIEEVFDEGAEIPHDLVKKFVAAGTPDEIIAQTEDMLKAGVNHVCYGYPLGKELKRSITMLSKHVISYFIDMFDL